MQHQDILENILHSTLKNSGPLHYFYRNVYGMEVDGARFTPDVNGYCLILMEAPDLSGYTSLQENFRNISRLFCYCAVDFTPPTTDVQSSEVSARVGAIPYATEVNVQQQCSISFYDNKNMDVFRFHNIWINYINDVTRGNVSPDPKYISADDTCPIDYLTSVYIIKFKPTYYTTVNDIIYIGKATGIFPISLPDKETIGSRNTNELTMLPITYKCAHYRQTTIGNAVDSRFNWLYEELSQLPQFNFSISGTDR